MKKIWSVVISIVIILVGVLVYFSWGLLYNSWFDRGVYSLVVPLILFGVFSLLLSLLKEN